eukprot:6492211-Amphidinium_carterae.2
MFDISEDPWENVFGGESNHRSERRPGTAPTPTTPPARTIGSALASSSSDPSHNAQRVQVANTSEDEQLNKKERGNHPNLRFSKIHCPSCSELRADLLEVLPTHYRLLIMSYNELTVEEMLVRLMQQILLSDDSSRLYGLEAIEAPMTPARNFTVAIQVLRSWELNMRTPIQQLGARPDSIRLFHAVQGLIHNMLKEDPEFAVEHGQIIRDTRLHSS